MNNLICSEKDVFGRQKKRELIANFIAVCVVLINLSSGYLWGAIVFSYPEPIPLIVYGLLPAAVVGLTGYKVIKFVCPHCHKSFYSKWDVWWIRDKCYVCKTSKE